MEKLLERRRQMSCCGVEKFLNGCLKDQNVEIYCGSKDDVYYGKVLSAADNVLSLEKDGIPIYIIIDKIQSICIAK